MNRLILTLSFLLILNVSAQEVFFKNFHSEELGVDRTLKIYVPPSYEKENMRFYPLTILLDGDFLFDVYLGNTQMFAQRDLAPEQIIVGIFQSENNERASDIAVDKVSGLPFENSEQFYRFVRGELLDWLESEYRLSPFKTIVGATQTANFINFFLIEKESVFDAFVNINPYYTPDMPVFLENALAALKQNQIYYYVNSGKYNGVELNKKIEDVVYMIKGLENPNINIKFDKFDNSTKVSSIGQAVPGALDHIFSGYAYISQEEYQTNIQSLTPPEAIDYLKKKYIDIEYLFGTNLKIRERDINAIESIIIDQENGKYLAEFGSMIRELYPESPLSEYYTGMYYEKMGKYSLALKNYKNGYSKIKNDAEAEAFFKNIERVQGREDELIQMEEAEKKERESRKEEWKEQKKAEQEMMGKFRRKEKKDDKK